MIVNTHGYHLVPGWIPDIPDKRDTFFYTVRLAPSVLPPSVDLRSFCSAVEDQGDLGSCSANALVGALELLENKDKVPFTDLSRLFLYYNERVIERSVLSDSGAMLRDGIKTLVRQGVCPESEWPYDIIQFDVRPIFRCYQDALNHQIQSYQRIIIPNEMRACLAEGYPFVFGFTVYESFESDEVANTGIVPMPNTDIERALGGHAVLAVGYDDGQKRFLVRNSWGPNWGMGGYFTIPYDYLGDQNLSDDFWVIRRAKNL